MKVKIINKSNNPLPQYETIGAAGIDIRADFSRIKLIDGKPEKFFFDADAVGISKGIAKTIEIRPGGRCLIPTGLFFQLPEGYEMQIRPRSGLSLKLGITIANSPGTLDCDYTGELMIILVNNSNVTVRINDKERICQIVFAKYEHAEFEEVETLDETERGDGGFGHTGVK